MEYFNSILKKTVFVLPFALILLCLSSCEGYKCANGKIVDIGTLKPLDSVICMVTSKRALTMTTDSSGKYNLCRPFGSCMFGCKDIEVEYSRKGYKTRSIMNPSESNILLEKQ